MREIIIRKLLWLRHGCVEELYGAVGEMQCPNCMVDFKRDSEKEIEEKFKDISRKTLKESFNSKKCNCKDCDCK